MRPAYLCAVPPVHLRPTAPIAPDAILPGDPGRALALAQDLLESPKMANHHRGLWGYSGETKAGGRPLTIQSTGIGGPSGAVVLTELAELGVRRAVRVGTCSALSGELSLGEMLVVEAALARDGASRALGAGAGTVPGADLLAALRASAPGAPGAMVATSDLYYGPPGLKAPELDGAVALDLGTAPLFALGPAVGTDVGCLLAVAESAGERIGEEELLRAELEMGRAAAAALAGLD
jgi:uridine phosphorylase